MNNYEKMRKLNHEIKECLLQEIIQKPEEFDLKKLSKLTSLAALCMTFTLVLDDDLMLCGIETAVEKKEQDP